MGCSPYLSVIHFRLPSDVPNHIQLNLRDINQLFNTIDPSPFQERDLDRNAEDLILSWAQEFPLNKQKIIAQVSSARDWFAAQSAVKLKLYKAGGTNGSKLD